MHMGRSIPLAIMTKNRGVIPFFCRVGASPYDPIISVVDAAYPVKLEGRTESYNPS